MQLDNANIIITGAAAGFGKAMSLYFSANGSVINAIDINQKALNLLHKEDPSINIYHCDITDNKKVEKTVDSIFEANFGVNVLINNAGIMKSTPLVNLLTRPDSRHPIDLWNKVINVNQNAVFYMTRSVVNKMIRNRNKGVILNISSIAAQGNAGQTAYAASKAAAESMTKVWAKELGGFGIRSVAIAPGFMNTQGTYDALEEKILNNWIDKTPLKRTGEISEVVLSAQFCIENDFLNGEILKINGGLKI